MLGSPLSKLDAFSTICYSTIEVRVDSQGLTLSFLCDIARHMVWRHLVTESSCISVMILVPCNSFIWDGCCLPGLRLARHAILPSSCGTAGRCLNSKTKLNGQQFS